MAKITKVLNAIQGGLLNRDADFTLAQKGIIGDGIINGLVLTQAGGAGTDITTPAGEALIKVTRTSVVPNEVFYTVFRNTSDDIITAGPNKFIYVEVTQANINDASLNLDPTGQGISNIFIEDTLPADNFIQIGATDGAGLLVLDDAKYIKLNTEVIDRADLTTLTTDIFTTGDIHGDNIEVATDLMVGGNVDVTGNVTADAFIGDGSGVTGVISETEKVLTKNIIPGEIAGNGVYKLRKGNKTQEDPNKVYIAKDGDDNSKSVGFYSGTLDGYSDPTEFWRGSDIEVYGNNVYGGVFSHTQASINRIEFEATIVGVSTYDFGIYPFDGFGNVDVGNPVLEIDTIPFTVNPSINEPTEYSVNPGIGGIPAILDGTETVYIIDGPVSYTVDLYKSSGFNQGVGIYIDGVLSSTEVNPNTGSYATYQITSNINALAGQTVDIRVRDLGGSPSTTCFIENILLLNSGTIDGLDLPSTAITPLEEYAFVFSNPTGDISNQLILRGVQETLLPLNTSTTTLSSNGAVSVRFGSDMSGSDAGSLVDIQATAEVIRNTNNYPSLRIVQDGNVLATLESALNTWTIIQITATNVDLSLGPIQVQHYNRDAGSGSSQMRDVEVILTNGENKYLESSSGVGGLSLRLIGGVYNKVLSDVVTSPIISTLSGSFLPLQILEDNSTYYTLGNGSGALTKDGVGNIPVGYTISNNKIIIGNTPLEVQATYSVIRTMANAASGVNNTWVQLRSVLISRNGTYRVNGNLQGDTGGGTCYCRVYKNGAPHPDMPQVNYNDTAAGIDFTRAGYFEAGDTLEMWGYDAGDTASVNSMQILGSLVEIPDTIL